MGDVSDSELIAASLTDAAKFDEIFVRYRDPIFRFVRRRIGPDGAADVTGEVFVRAFAGRSRYDTGRPSARSWLFGIANHACIDHLRRQRLRRDRGIQIAAGWVYRPAPEDDQAVADAEVQRYAPALLAALETLRETERQVLLLSAVGDLTYVEIGDVLGLPLGTVKSTLSRTKQRIREQMGDAARTLFSEEEEWNQ